MEPKHQYKYAKVIDGKRYSVATSDLLAHDRVWRDETRQTRNRYLYRTFRGAYYMLDASPAEREVYWITPLSREDAELLYKQLPVQEVSWDDAFGALPQDA